MAIKANIVIDQHSEYIAEILVDAANNTNYNLDNYTAKGSIKKSYFATSNVQFTASVSNAEIGQITLNLTSSQTGSLTPGRYVYDVIIIDEANTVTRVVEGIATVTPGVTTNAG